MGCKYVILGHSERREYFTETDENVNKKAKAAFKNGLLPIVCVGEKLDHREKGITEQVVKTQVEGGIKGLEKDQVARLVVAYEPVWAIGTGKPSRSSVLSEVLSPKCMARNWLTRCVFSMAAVSNRITLPG